MSRPVRRTGTLMLFAGSRQKRLEAALASRTPAAYVMIRLSSPRTVARALAAGGHTTRLARRAARLCAGRLHNSSSAAEIVRLLVPYAETPRVLASLYAVIGEYDGGSFTTALRRHPSDDAQVLWLLSSLPANAGAAAVVGVAHASKRRLVAARYGSDLALEEAVAVLAAGCCFASDVAFSSVIETLDRFHALDPSGAWVSLLVSELARLDDTPSAALAARCRSVEDKLTRLGPELAVAAKMRQAGSPASLDELLEIVTLEPSVLVSGR